MSDATTVALALGPALITGVVGYCGARLQTAVAIRQVESENEHLRAQYEEAERQRRLDGYHELLTLLYRLDAMMAGFAPLSKEAFDVRAQQIRSNIPFERKFADSYRGGRERLVATAELAIEAMRNDVSLP